MKRRKNIKRKPKELPLVTVHLVEEYGYRFWLWCPMMHRTQLIKWWQNMETVRPHFHEPDKTLPGTLLEAKEDDIIHPHDFKGHIHTDDDSWLMCPNGKVVFHKGFRNE
jgi:hypothetical protein